MNTASQCGLTPQFEGLQQLHDRFDGRGFTVLGFPCDQFRHQEPGDDAEIAGFCQRNFGVTFPMFSKIEVNGDGATRSTSGCARRRAACWATRSSGTSPSS